MKTKDPKTVAAVDLIGRTGAACRAIVTRTVEDGRSFEVVRVPWKPNEIELAHLAQGGTIWLSTWGGLPAHMLEVQGP